VHNDWVNSRWPDLRTLRNLEFVSVFVSSVCLAVIPTVSFLAIALPHGWPTKSFFMTVPVSKQESILWISISAEKNSTKFSSKQFEILAKFHSKNYHKNFSTHSCGQNVYGLRPV
jgi:hypothetical protein